MTPLDKEVAEWMYELGFGRIGYENDDGFIYVKKKTRCLKATHGICN